MVDGFQPKHVTNYNRFLMAEFAYLNQVFLPSMTLIYVIVINLNTMSNFFFL